VEPGGTSGGDGTGGMSRCQDKNKLLKWRSLRLALGVNKFKLNVDKTDLIILVQNNNETKLSTTFQLKYLVVTHQLRYRSELRCCLWQRFLLLQVCKSCFYHIFDFHRVRHDLFILISKTISDSVAMINSW